MKRRTHFLRTAFGFLLSLFMLTPFAMIVLNSFKTKKEAAELGLALPKQWNILENYRAVMETGVLHAFRNSCIVTCLSVLLIILLSALAAFILQRRNTRFSRKLTTFFVLGLIVPGQIIPTYMLCSYLHLKTFAGAAAVLTAANPAAWNISVSGCAQEHSPRHRRGGNSGWLRLADALFSRRFPAAQAHDGDALYPDVYEHLERFRDDDLFPEHV